MRRWAGAFVSSVLLVAVVAGVPTMLVRFVGRPFPSRLPLPSEAFDSVQRTGVDPTTVVKLLALVLWIAWARLAMAIAIELVAQARRRPAPQIRGLGSAQRWAASLLASASLFSGVMGTARGAGASERPDSLPSSMFAWAGDGLALGGAARATPPPTGPPVAAVTWTVARNDSLWRIAEHTLGDGTRWREVLTANVGREVAPGVVFSSADHPILPGWVLVIPADGSVAPPVRPTATVAPGDTLSSIAEHAFGDRDAWPTIWEANRGTVFDGRRFDDPNRLFPGWTLVIPDDIAGGPVGAPATEPSPAPATPSGEERPDVPATVRPLRTAEAAARDATDFSVQSRPVNEPSTPDPDGVDPSRPDQAATCTPPVTGVPASESGPTLGLGAATLLATATMGLVTARRRRRLRTAAPGARALPPPPALIDLEQTLRAASADETMARLDLAVRGAVAQLAEAAEPGAARGRLVGAWTTSAGEVGVLLDGDVPMARSPFVAGPGGWRIAAGIPTVEIPSGGRYAPFPCPALVQLGTSDGRDLFVDLEAIGVLGIDGSRRHTRSIVQHLAATVALAPFGTRCCLLTTGIDPVVTEVDPAAEHHDGLDAAIERAAGALTPVLGVLRPGQTTALVRAASAGEPWEPVVLFAGAEVVVGALGRELVELGSTPGRGLAIVSDAPGLRTAWKLQQLESAWRLEPLGLEVVPTGLSVPQSTLVRDLLAGSDLGPVAAPVRAERAVADDDEPLPVWSFLVRTFGRPCVTTLDGAEVEFARSKSMELVVWLVRHRRTATRTGARNALWEAEVANGTFANVVSDARQSLALAIEPVAGEQWIGRTLTERLELHDAVLSDVDLVEHHLRRARREAPVAARRTLTAALDLIAGPPFTGAPYLWPDAEGVVSQDILLATSVAAELAELCLASRDLEGVFRATSVGLAVLPGHEELLALRMRSHAARGDLAAVRQEWEGYERIIAGDPLGDGEPSARLVRLRNDLLGLRRTPTG